MGYEEDGWLVNSNIPGKNGGKSGGLKLGLLYDNRNNVLNSTAGTYIDFAYILHRKFVGSEFDYTITTLDARTYFQPFAQLNHVLAFQIYGYFTDGNTHFTDLAALGGGDIMRGYYEGRYRDNHLLAAQAEYRLHLWRRIGAVGFISFGEVAPAFNEFSFSGIKPAGGIGLRYKIMEKENLNLRLDVAFGKNTSGIYINISEAF
jgi:outer membrane translocation and assembly module TamA